MTAAGIIVGFDVYNKLDVCMIYRKIKPRHLTQKMPGNLS